MAYGSYLNEDDPYAYQDPYQTQDMAVAPAPAPQTPYFGAGLGPSAPPGAVPFTGQSQGNLDASVAAGTPNNLPVNQPGAPAAGGYSGPKDFPSIVKWWQSQHPATAADLPGLVKLLNAQGIPATQALHANGTLPSDERIVLNGQTFKLGHSLGGSDGFWFGDVSPEGAGGGGSDGAGIDPSFLAPYTRQFQAPGDAALPQFQAPGAFHMPTMADVMADPGYKFREGRITDQIQNSASAAGLLNSTGTLDRIAGSIGDFAGQEYGNVFNRNYNLWNTDYAHALDQYNLATQRANTTYDRGLGEFGLDRDLFYSNQDRPFNKVMQGVDLGARAAAA